MKTFGLKKSWSFSELMTSALKTFFTKKANTLKKLTFGTYGFADGFLEHVNFCQKIEELSCNCSYRISAAELISISQLQNLKTLELQSVRIDLAPLLTNLNLEKMEHLDISRGKSFNLETFMILANRSCPNLKALDLNFCMDLKLTDEALKKLLDNCPQLKRLNIAGINDSELSDEMLYEIDAKQGVRLYLNMEKERSVEKYIKYHVKDETSSRSRKHLRNQFLLNFERWTKRRKFF